MDDRVEIIDAPQPLQPHPGSSAAVARHNTKATYTAPTSGADVNVNRRGLLKLALALMSLMFSAAVLVLNSINEKDPPPLGYVFGDHMALLPFGWAIIILLFLSVVCATVAIIINSGRTQWVITGIGWVALLFGIILSAIAGYIAVVTGAASSL